MNTYINPYIKVFMFKSEAVNTGELIAISGVETYEDWVRKQNAEQMLKRKLNEIAEITSYRF